MKYIFNLKKNLSDLIKRLTFIDSIIFVVIFIALGIFLIFLRRENKYIEVRLKVTDSDVQYMDTRHLDEYAYAFTKGDTEYNEIGQLISQITHVYSYHTEPSKQVVYLTMKIKATYSPRKKQFTFKGMPVVIGQTITFTLSTIKFTGIILDHPNIKGDIVRTPQPVTIRAQLRDTIDSRAYSDTFGVQPYIASAVKIGDSVKDMQGNTIAKVTQVEVFPAKRTIVTNSDMSVTIFDDELKDVFYTIQANAFKQGESYYLFDYIPLFIGQKLPLSFANITVLPTITEIIYTHD